MMKISMKSLLVLLSISSLTQIALSMNKLKNLFNQMKPILTRKSNNPGQLETLNILDIKYDQQMDEQQKLFWHQITELRENNTCFVAYKANNTYYIKVIEPQEKEVYLRGLRYGAYEYIGIELVDFRGLKGSNLEELHLTHSDITFINFNDFKGTNLKTLDLFVSEKITSIDWTGLNETKIEELDLRGCLGLTSLNFNGLKGSSLKTILLDRTGLSSVDFTGVNNSNLEDLDFGRNEFTPINLNGLKGSKVKYVVSYLDAGNIERLYFPNGTVQDFKN